MRLWVVVEVANVAENRIMSEHAFRTSPVADDEWSIVDWLWQAFRQDLAEMVHGLPYPDGRYQARQLDLYPSEDTMGYLAWRPHPKTGEDAPIGFALIDGLTGARRSILGLWVAPAARRGGVGHQLAAEVVSRHAGPWLVGFQHDNHGAGTFWRAFADATFGDGRWTERRQPIPAVPDAPADHIIEWSTGEAQSV
jgi:predicted acetyltransferase